MGFGGGDGKELELPILMFNGSLPTLSSSARGRTGPSHQFHDIVVLRQRPGGGVRLVRTNLGDSWSGP